eukprot:Amastigsp_a342151_11.p8 type:complete len:105 gc:universal Amastigsp_a342151_11:2743-3057(+)
MATATTTTTDTTPTTATATTTTATAKTAKSCDCSLSRGRIWATRHRSAYSTLFFDFKTQRTTSHHTDSRRWRSVGLRLVRSQSVCSDSLHSARASSRCCSSCSN